MFSVNFLAFLSEFDFEGYMLRIMNMKKKKKMMHLLFKLGQNFAT